MAAPCALRPVLAESHGPAPAGLPQYRSDRRHGDAQDRLAQPAGRSAQLCAVVQIRERRQRASVRGDQHAPHPQRDAERRRHRRAPRRPRRSRPRAGPDRPDRRAHGRRGRPDLCDARGRGGHRQPLFARPRPRRQAPGQHRRSRRRARHHRRAGSGHAYALGKERAAADPAPGDVRGDRSASSRDRRAAHRKPDRSPDRPRQPPPLPGRA